MALKTPHSPVTPNPLAAGKINNMTIMKKNVEIFVFENLDEVLLEFMETLVRQTTPLPKWRLWG